MKLEADNRASSGITIGRMVTAEEEIGGNLHGGRDEEDEGYRIPTRRWLNPYS